MTVCLAVLLGGNQWYCDCINQTQMPLCCTHHTKGKCCARQAHLLYEAHSQCQKGDRKEQHDLYSTTIKHRCTSAGLSSREKITQLAVIYCLHAVLDPRLEAAPGWIYNNTVVLAAAALPACCWLLPLVRFDMDTDCDCMHTQSSHQLETGCCSYVNCLQLSEGVFGRN